MKTPRELLFARHRQAGPKLDAVRRQVLSTLLPPAGAGTPQPGRSAKPLIEALLRNVWRELIWPSRRAWVAMAAVWFAVWAANLEMKTPLPVMTGPQTAPGKEMAQAFAEQQRLLTELLPPGNRSPAQALPPRNRPRSELTLPFKAC